jgi:hypothetical protein
MRGDLYEYNPPEKSCSLEDIQIIKLNNNGSLPKQVFNENFKGQHLEQHIAQFVACGAKCLNSCFSSSFPLFYESKY